MTMSLRDSVHQLFSAAFPGETPRLCRAPGRINLIGEHVDYCGLSVLPMAVSREIVVAYAPSASDEVTLANVDPAFSEVRFANAAQLEPSPDGAWDNYVKAAVQGVNDHFRVAKPPGFQAVFGGNIPGAAGLSSSSAMVVAASLVYLDVLGKRIGEDITRIELANLLAEAEYFVGTRGGGMDQAIILLGKAGHACKIDFGPLRAEHVPLFEGHCFVACNSLVKSEKSGDMRHRYNAGPYTARLIRALVEKQLRTDYDEDIALANLGDLWFGPLCMRDSEVADLFDATFPTDRMTLKEAGHRLGLSEADLRKRFIEDLCEPEGGFRLKARARHILTEFGRVEMARDLLLAGDDPEAFGALMDASHRSCAEDYQVSCPELDALTQAAREAGALGARMTGAGFGGCTVNLVPEANLDCFFAGVEKAYYRGFLGMAELPPDAIIVAEAASGAGLL